MAHANPRPSSKSQPRSEAPRTPVSPAVRPSTEEIARRAYELFQLRGATHGHDLEDWLQAERDLGARRSVN